MCSSFLFTTAVLYKYNKIFHGSHSTFWFDSAPITKHWLIHGVRETRLKQRMWNQHHGQLTESYYFTNKLQNVKKTKQKRKHLLSTAYKINIFTVYSWTYTGRCREDKAGGFLELLTAQTTSSGQIHPSTTRGSPWITSNVHTIVWEPHSN